MNGLCSHEQLKLALAGKLNADEESSLHLHLDACELCAAEMEQLSGGEQASREIAAMFMPDGLDDALPLREECSTADFVVDHLEPSDDPAVLGRLGGYDVLDIIGRGGMGVVLKGFDRELKRFVAIKALAPYLAHSALARKRFAREAQAAAAVVNLHVIAIHQVQPNGQLPFLVMPLLTGESLAQRLKARGTLELKEVLRIGMQAAEGLAAAHGQGLIHRDVKPANILLEKGVERTVLTDFGLARAADDVSMTRRGIIAGTPEYMSPEQARGEALDGRSDLFSLGCVLYEMATGVSPFRTDSTMATLRRIVDEQPAAMASLVPELTPWFCHIVERLLSKDPSQRFASASEVSQLLEQCLSHLQQPASVPLPASLMPHAGGRRSIFNVTRKGVLTMLGTIGMTLLGLVLWQATEAPDISGQWTSEEWGAVVLETNGPGQYEGTFGGNDKTGKPATGNVTRRGVGGIKLTSPGSVKDQPAEGATGLPGSGFSGSSSEILPGSPGASGMPSDSNNGPSGTLHLKWSRVERRFNGTWGKGADRRGAISLRLVDTEIRGGWTTDEDIQLESGTPLLGDLMWKRSVVTVPDGGTILLGGQQHTNRSEVRPAPVLSNVTIAEKTATVSGMGGDDLDCVLRIGKSKKNEQLEWTTPVNGQFSATLTATDQLPSNNGKMINGIVLSIQNPKSSNTTNIAMSEGDPVPTGEVRFRQPSAMDRADTFWTFADIHCDDGTRIPISILLRANQPLLPAGALTYDGKVRERVRSNRDGLSLSDEVRKPVPDATLQLYRVSPIIKGGSGYKFEEIDVFKTDKEGHFKIAIPDNLKRFIPTLHTKEWDDWESLLLVTTSAPGFATDSLTLAANRGLHSIELIRGTSIQGRLVDENGKPVIGAHITVNEQSRSNREEMDQWLSQTSREPLQKAEFDPADTDALLAARTPASIANHYVQWIPTQIEGVVTDQNGQFTIDGIGPDDVLDLNVECVGYRKSSIKALGRDIATVYSRDPFSSGENIAVHGRTLQVALIAADRDTTQRRHRIIKNNRTRGQDETSK